MATSKSIVIHTLNRQDWHQTRSRRNAAAGAKKVKNANMTYRKHRSDQTLSANAVFALCSYYDMTQSVRDIYAVQSTRRCENANIGLTLTSNVCTTLIWLLALA